jgi:anti-anti-sigma regulatory factor
MHDLAPGVHTFPLEGPLLDAAQVAKIAHAVRAMGELAWLVIDCRGVTEVSAAGLSALLELGQASTPLRSLALAGLDKTLTRVAIEVRLAAHFAIFKDVQAFEHARIRAQPPAHEEPERCAL